jgi:hypothetical protein
VESLFTTISKNLPRHPNVVIVVALLLESRYSALANMQPSPNAERPYNVHMVVQDVVIASSRGTKFQSAIKLNICLISFFFLVSILRAFLVEEAKIVKKVIKSQEKAAASK